MLIKAEAPITSSKNPSESIGQFDLLGVFALRVLARVGRNDDAALKIFGKIKGVVHEHGDAFRIVGVSVQDDGSVVDDQDLRAVVVHRSAQPVHERGGFAVGEFDRPSGLREVVSREKAEAIAGGG
jgi:hypothetical protein